MCIHTYLHMYIHRNTQRHTHTHTTQQAPNQTAHISVTPFNENTKNTLLTHPVNGEIRPVTVVKVVSAEYTVCKDRPPCVLHELMTSCAPCIDSKYRSFEIQSNTRDFTCMSLGMAVRFCMTSKKYVHACHKMENRRLSQVHTYIRSCMHNTSQPRQVSSTHLHFSTGINAKAGENSNPTSDHEAVISAEQSVIFKWSLQVELCLLITKQDTIIHQHFQGRSNG